ncbi:hypothetical protein P8452_34918 [Trifolium repens]|nr:hypothetical protein P8452_34918 [Trifolium repens]
MSGSCGWSLVPTLVVTNVIYKRADICKHRGIDCQNNENGNSLYLTCKGNGKSGTLPLTNGITHHPIEDLCFRLRGA